MESGELCAMMDLILMMLTSFVTSYPCHLKVCDHKIVPYSTVNYYYSIASAVLTGTASFGPGTGPVFIETLSCNGDEMNILECRDINMRRQFCTHAMDVSVQCIGKTNCRQH